MSPCHGSMPPSLETTALNHTYSDILKQSVYLN